MIIIYFFDHPVIAHKLKLVHCCKSKVNILMCVCVCVHLNRFRCKLDQQCSSCFSFRVMMMNKYLIKLDNFWNIVRILVTTVHCWIASLKVFIYTHKHTQSIIWTSRIVLNGCFWYHYIKACECVEIKDLYLLMSNFGL